MESKDVDIIAQKCNEFYNKLPLKGKPIDDEWTVLSCIIKITGNNDIEIVSLGTGSKCIGAVKMCPKGLLLNDSHAEVMARRGFLIYLYDNISKILDGKSSIFIIENGKCKLKSNIQFIFFSSQLPCGDASIIPKAGDEELFGDIIASRKRHRSEDMLESEYYRDVHRTGAKCLPNLDQDPKNSPSDYHLLCKVRTKPGRGDRTLSVSCSDKIARWIHLGVQGGLLNSLLLHPIYIKYFIFGANTPYSEHTLRRALLSRHEDGTLSDTLEYAPQFYQSSIGFAHVRNRQRSRPTPGSIVWVKLDKPTLEVAVMGMKQGANKKFSNLLANSLSISKHLLFRRYLLLLDRYKILKDASDPELIVANAEYDSTKRKFKDYVNKWLQVKETFFKAWTEKPKMWNFTVLLE